MSRNFLDFATFETWGAQSSESDCRSLRRSISHLVAGCCAAARGSLFRSILKGGVAGLRRGPAFFLHASRGNRVMGLELFGEDAGSGIFGSRLENCLPVFLRWMGKSEFLSLLSAGIRTPGWTQRSDRPFGFSTFDHTAIVKIGNRTRTDPAF
ncbi:MAG: hypothetical protein VX768_07125 [Planctomycetota bacterium]|nr:hypothetical protein [Planctomycetota bacterium]